MNKLKGLWDYRLKICFVFLIGLYGGIVDAALDHAYCSADADVLFRQCHAGVECDREITKSIGNAVRTFTSDKGCFGKFEQFESLESSYNPENASLADASRFLKQLKQPIIDLRDELSLAPAGEMSDALRFELHKTITVFESQDFSEETRNNGVFTVAYWHTAIGFGTANIGIGTANKLALIDLYEYLKAACLGKSSPSDDCLRRFDELRSTLRTTQTLRALFNYSSSFQVYLAEFYVERLLDEWRYYFEEARVQYPWELASDLDEVIDQTSTGLLRAPDSQTFWLHPTAALSYADGAEHGQQVRPTAILELYGKNYWDFDPLASKAKLDGHAWGWSLITNYTDIDGIDGSGVGVSVHYDHRYTVSITYHDDDEWVISLNFNPARYLQNLWKERKQKEVKRAKETGRELVDKIWEIRN
ncbi:MAG: hypothetical protein GY806_12830 [Gammaproteobacteria bacterium]|nr:hypothetical protein [Gammaproteobacteria bacterium]